MGDGGAQSRRRLEPRLAARLQQQTAGQGGGVRVGLREPALAFGLERGRECPQTRIAVLARAPDGGDEQDGGVVFRAPVGVPGKAVELVAVRLRDDHAERPHPLPIHGRSIEARQVV
jgi:hypothetical protein